MKSVLAGLVPASERSPGGRRRMPSSQQGTSSDGGSPGSPVMLAPWTSLKDLVAPGPAGVQRPRHLSAAHDNANPGRTKTLRSQTTGAVKFWLYEPVHIT